MQQTAKSKSIQSKVTRIKAKSRKKKLESRRRSSTKMKFQQQSARMQYAEYESERAQEKLVESWWVWSGNKHIALFTIVNGRIRVAVSAVASCSWCSSGYCRQIPPSLPLSTNW